MNPKPGDRAAIDLIVGNLHVGTPDEEIEYEIRRRIAHSDMAYPTGYDDALVAYALKVHHANGDLYRRVMGGLI